MFCVQIEYPQHLKEISFSCERFEYMCKLKCMENTVEWIGVCVGLWLSYLQILMDMMTDHIELCVGKDSANLSNFLSSFKDLPKIILGWNGNQWH